MPAVTTGGPRTKRAPRVGRRAGRACDNPGRSVWRSRPQVPRVRPRRQPSTPRPLPVGPSAPPVIALGPPSHRASGIRAVPTSRRSVQRASGPPCACACGRYLESFRRCSRYSNVPGGAAPVACRPFCLDTPACIVILRCCSDIPGRDGARSAFSRRGLPGRSSARPVHPGTTRRRKHGPPIRLHRGPVSRYNPRQRCIASCT